MSAAITDIRDLRDPEVIGQRLLGATKSAKKTKASRRADKILADQTLPLYNKSESTATIAAKAYMDELEARAADGDVFAQSSLKFYREHGRIQGAPMEPSE